MGIISAIIAGALMSLQGVFNTKTSARIGICETNFFVQGSGFLLSLIILLIWGNGDLKKLVTVDKIYLSGGILGVFIIYTVTLGISKLGASHAIAVILVSQLLAAAAIDFFGFFNCDKISISLAKISGIALMIFGIIIFKWKG